MSCRRGKQPFVLIALIALITLYSLIALITLSLDVSENDMRANILRNGEASYAPTKPFG
jgi:hypothetical protein